LTAIDGVYKGVPIPKERPNSGATACRINFIYFINRCSTTILLKITITFDITVQDMTKIHS